MLNKKNIFSSIFRAYYIRGIVDYNITENTAYLIGRAIGSESLMHGEKFISIARDGRLSSITLYQRID